MGAYLSEPVIDKYSSDDANDLLDYGASSMQGWRISQEDAHNCILEFDKNASLFAVYDGHGGAEVALYCAQSLPAFLRMQEQFQLGNYEQALCEAFIGFDGTLVNETVIETLKKLAATEEKDSSAYGEDADCENLSALRKEGDMPLNEVLARYIGEKQDQTNSLSLVEETCTLNNSHGNETRKTANTESDQVLPLENSKNAEGQNGTSKKGEVYGSSGVESASNGSETKPLNNCNDVLDTVEKDDGDNKSYSIANRVDDEDDNDDNDDEYDDDDDEDDDEEDSEEDGEDDSFLNSMVEEPGSSSGCTAVVALLVDRELYVANAGDSRCVVSRNGVALDMSIDHKPEDDIEQTRIQNAGGRVTLDGRVNGGLNLSRAIGDHAYKQRRELKPEEQMISPLPDVKHITISKDDEFMIIACDGIWNSMSSQIAVDFVRERIDDGRVKLSTICEELFHECLAANTIGDGTGCDNMTAVIVRFKPNLQVIPFLNKKRCASPNNATTEPDVTKRMKTDVDAEPTALSTTSKMSETDPAVVALAEEHNTK